MVRIPSEYQEVEYIESTGTQWIDTGIQAISGVECTASIMWISGTANDSCILGARKESSSRIILIHQYPAKKWTLGYGPSYTHLSSLDYGKIYNIESKLLAGEQLLRVNKETIYEGTDDSEYSNTCNLAMFACRYDNNAKSVRLYSNARIYSMLIKNSDDEPLANFVPCYRKSDDEIGMYDTVSKQFYTNSGTGTFLKGNDVTYDPISLLETRRRILLNTPHIESASGSIATFNTDMSAKLPDMKIHFYPVQAGSGDPSPDNVRPITGWDGVTVTRCGKNLLGGDKLANFLFPNGNYVIHSDGNGRYIEWTNIRHSVVSFPSGMIKDNRQYTFIAKVDSTNNTAVFVPYYTDSSYASWSATIGLNTKKYLTAMNKTISGLRLQQRSATIKLYIDESGWFEDNIDITSYEPYQPSLEIPISFGRTIYGGYVDLVKGEVVEEWTLADMGSTSWDRAWGTFRTTPTGINIHSVIGTKVNVISEIYPTGTVDSATRVATIDKMIRGRNNYRHTLIRDTDYSEASEFKEAITGYKWAYKLEAPNTYPLTPQTIKALKGINNIWSSANGDVEVKFWKH